MKLKIVSWNIWTAGKFEETKKFLQNSSADIIGLQEVQANKPRRDIIQFLTALGYSHIFAPIRKVYPPVVIIDGPALFTKQKPILTKKYLLSNAKTRAAVRADIKVGNKTLHVLSTHLLHTHQKRAREQTEQGDNLLKIIPDKNSIVVGDFNATPVSDVIKLMRNNFIDTDPNSKPTWSNYRMGCMVCRPKSVNIKLDYIFTTKDIDAHDFKVEKSKASDHLPISAVFEI